MWQVARAKYTDAEAIAAIEDSGGIDIEGVNPVMIAVHATNQPTKDAKIGVVQAGANSYPGIWLAQAAPDVTNYAFMVGGTATLFNAPAGGSIAFRIGNANKMKLHASGGFAIGDSFYATDPGVDDVSIEKDLSIRATTATRPLDINSSIMRLRSAYTPATAGSAGYQGDLCWDADYFYICVATNTWERTPHAWDTFKFDAIVENTADNGVNVETVNIKDGHINELQKLIFKDPTELVINGGSITVTQSRHSVDTQNNDATDDLAMIVGGENGQILILNTEDNTRNVVLKHGIGNILIAGGDYTMDLAYDIVMLIYTGTYWMKLM